MDWEALFETMTDEQVEAIKSLQADNQANADKAGRVDLLEAQIVELQSKAPDGAANRTELLKAQQDALSWEQQFKTAEKNHQKARQNVERFKNKASEATTALTDYKAKRASDDNWSHVKAALGVSGKPAEYLRTAVAELKFGYDPETGTVNEDARKADIEAVQGDEDLKFLFNNSGEQPETKPVFDSGYKPPPPGSGQNNNDLNQRDIEKLAGAAYASDNI